MENQLYGYLLDDNVLFNIDTRRLLHCTEEFYEHAGCFRIISLSEVQTRLLICLLDNRKKDVIYKDDILKSVWDEFNLPSSSQRLWQTINGLRKRLAFIGLPDDFIENIHGVGYSVIDSKIGKLHLTT